MQKKKNEYLAHVPNEMKKKEGNGLRCFMINGRDTTGNYLIKIMCIPTTVYTLLVAYNICYAGKTERNPELFSTETVFKYVRRSSLISDNIRFKIRNLKYFERIKCMFSYSSRVGRDGTIAREPAHPRPILYYYYLPHVSPAMAVAAGKL